MKMTQNRRAPKRSNRKIGRHHESGGVATAPHPAIVQELLKMLKGSDLVKQVEHKSADTKCRCQKVNVTKFKTNRKIVIKINYKYKSHFIDIIVAANHNFVDSLEKVHKKAIAQLARHRKFALSEHAA